jgi:nucleotide-binding universal stress UspA family protein
LRFAPQGISHLTILTAYPRSYTEAIRAFLPEFITDPAAWIQGSIEKRSTEIATQLALLGTKIEVRVSDGEPNAAITQAMRQTEADLLILGSRGHGGLERLLLGSVAFHQVIGEPYSTLVLRPATKAEKAEVTSVDERLPVLL